MQALFSVYLKTTNEELKKRLLDLFEENKITLEDSDIFNSDFAILDEPLNYSFPHMVICEDVKSLNNYSIFKNDGIDIIQPFYSEDILRMKLQNAIYFVMARGSRGIFKQRIIKELEEIERKGGKFSLGMISILDFNKHKTQMSSLSLDEVSKEIIKMMKLTIRKTDDVVKLSRNEYGLIFPETELRNAEIACERIKRRGLKINQDSRPINLACGIIEVNPKENEIALILEKLKKALYISEGNNGEVSFF
jgi:GGDEF domain-containing protein